MQAEPDRLYTFADYIRLEGDDRWELFDGQIQLMGAPTVLHQALVTELAFLLRSYFPGKPCRVLASPLAVKLSERDAVQPDLLVVCGSDSLKETHIDGPPELVIEILSPSTQRTDRLRKLNLYARSGVGEYWIVTPHPLMFEVLRNRGGLFEVAGVYSEPDLLASPRFPDLRLNLADLYAALPAGLREPAPAYSF